mmetsp:Transcript_87827/g.221062  ORF Transcript_87827/g.221062 Transcript_87827/m.221062 type:complete len:205 (-) Transcript_87827:81-695(-)
MGKSRVRHLANDRADNHALDASEVLHHSRPDSLVQQEAHDGGDARIIRIEDSRKAPTAKCHRDTNRQPIPCSPGEVFGVADDGGIEDAQHSLAEHITRADRASDVAGQPCSGLLLPAVVKKHLDSFSVFLANAREAADPKDESVLLQELEADARQSDGGLRFVEPCSQGFTSRIERVLLGIHVLPFLLRELAIQHGFQAQPQKL